MPIVVDVVVNLLSDLVFWAGLGIAFIVILRLSQRKLRRFFGIADGRALHVCLSNLWRPDYRPPPVEGATYQYIGYSELEASRTLDLLFSSTNFRLPDIVRGLVDSFWAKNTRTVVTGVSPSINEPGIGFQYINEPLIVVGGSRWNTVRRHFVRDLGLSMQFSTEVDPNTPKPQGEALYVAVRRGNALSAKVDEPEYSLAILEKWKRHDGAVIFFCAGARGDISRATVEYLVRNWRKLYKEYGEASFALCLGFPGAIDGHLPNYVEPTLLRYHQ